MTTMKKPDTYTIIWLAVGIVIIIGIAWYLISASTSGIAAAPLEPATGTAQTPPDSSAAATPAPAPRAGAPSAAAGTSTPSASKPGPSVAGVGSLNELRLFRTPYSCSISTTSGDNRAGTLYISGDGMVRADLTSAVSMLDDGTHLYAWVTGATTGLELPAATSASGSAMASHGALDPVAVLSYACYAWTEDASVFAPPSGIAFSNTSGN